MEVFLWKLSQYSIRGFDTYDSCVVAACSEQEAKEVYPNRFYTMKEARRLQLNREWPTDTEEIYAEKIGRAEENVEPNTLIISSFNAG